MSLCQRPSDVSPNKYRKYQFLINYAQLNRWIFKKERNWWMGCLRLIRQIETIIELDVETLDSCPRIRDESDRQIVRNF